ncbi:hypothetical protein D9611_001111 [Ephemerocybe angulata]|uniref:DUF7330 domain-containing protein n=1 Tax=Ephemerocybe angulata TaxID=980116 RepID=A0A8H5CJA8_9AGAR|nr:hypothetical protein D9611_001111 [Tulosesus angulatus]
MSPSLYSSNLPRNRPRAAQLSKRNMPVFIYYHHNRHHHHDQTASRDPRPRAQTTTFDLPASGPLYFLSEGSLSGGDLAITTSADQDENTVGVTVTVYCDESLLNLFRVCTTSRRSGESGVGIFLINDDARHPWIYAAARLGKRGSPLWIEKLETNMQNTSIAIDADRQYVSFGYLKLRTVNGAISSTSQLTMIEGSVDTTNGKVSGTWIATRSLTIETTNGSIEGQYRSSGILGIATTNRPIEQAAFILENKDASKKSVLNLETSNAPIDADIYLEGDIRNPKYEITAQASNRPLNLSIQTMPVDSTLILSGNTSNKSAYVSLPAEFQGSFDLGTSRERVDLVKSTRTDPKGAGRTRVWRISSLGFGGTNVSGSTYWSKGSDESKIANYGSVTLFTSNAKATLEL